MMDNRVFCITIRILLLWLPCFFLSGTVFSFPYQPVQTIDIQTELLKNPETAGSSTTRLWTVKLVEGENGSNLVAFFPKGKDQSICQVAVSQIGGPVEWMSDIEPPKLMSAEGLLIVTGFPAPCDILPVNVIAGQASEAVYEIKSGAGGRVFVNEILVSFSPVSFAQARENGWIKDGLSDLAPLRMVEAVNKRTGKMIVRQLWPVGDSWWIYEETEFRNSWRMP